MEHHGTWSFIVGFPIKIVIFHSYVKLPEGMFIWAPVHLLLNHQKGSKRPSELAELVREEPLFSAH